MNSKTRRDGVGYDETGDAGLVCLRCGVSHPTLRTWRHRHQALGSAPGICQYTAIDDCSCYKVLGVYPRHLSFLERVAEEMPFFMQRIQTDRGLKFSAEDDQRR